MKTTNETIQQTDHTPRKLTPRENAILTIKVLAGFAVLGGALWGLTLLKAAQ